MTDGDHPVARLLAADRPTPAELGGLTARLALLDPLEARVTVRPGELAYRTERFVDPRPGQGLSHRLARRGVRAILLRRDLDEVAVEALLGLDASTPLPPLRGLGLEIPGRTRRPPEELQALIDAASLDHESGVDLLLLYGLGRGGAPVLRPTSGRDVAARIQQHLGHDRLSSIRDELDRGLANLRRGRG